MEPGPGSGLASTDSAAARQPVQRLTLRAVAAWWENALFYEIYPRSFSDSDGDGIGDLQGVASRLEYLSWLGVDAIWLAPIYRSPLADLGYDVSDHTAIAPELGSDRDFDDLVEAAHRRGIRVVVDLVASHTSIEHAWFREHPDRYVWADGPGPPNNWTASFGGPAWSRDERSGRWYLHSFFPEQPDLDWRNPDVRRAMGDVVRHWISRGVDGFRVDAVDRLMKDAALRDDPPSKEPFPLPLHPDAPPLSLVHSRDDPEIPLALEALRVAAGEAPLIGEVYLPADRLRPYLSHLDRVFAFDLLHATWEPGSIVAAISASLSVSDLAWVTSNHDFSRVASRWGIENVRAAAVLLCTLPGCAFLYQGEEIGMADGPGGSPPLDRFGRDAFRHPMQWEPAPDGGFGADRPWLPLTDPQRTSVASQRADSGSLLSLYRKLIALRREISGPLTDLVAEDGLVRFRRGSGHGIAINVGTEREQLPGPDRGRSIALRSVPGAGEHATLSPGEAVVTVVDR